MTDLTKKELVSHLYDAFADQVAAEDKELKDLHKYLTPAEQHDNLVIDITKAVKEAGWQVSPGILDALCRGGAELMTLDLEEEIIVPPVVPVDEAGLRTDGPTLEEYVAAGYAATGYPPQGYAARPSAAPAAVADEQPQPGPVGVEPGKAPGDIPDAAAGEGPALEGDAGAGAPDPTQPLPEGTGAGQTEEAAQN